MSVNITQKSDNMAASNLNLPHFPVFDILEVDTLSHRWTTYKKTF